MTRIVAAILAGGDARRLGGIDKCLIPLAGRPLLAHLLDRLLPQVDSLALGANGDPARFSAFAVPVLPDARRGIGPLAGLAVSLSWATTVGADALLTVPGDTPFIPPDLRRALHPAPAVAVSNGRHHHLVALWPVSWAASLDRYLSALPSDAPRRAFGVLAFAATMPPMREVRFGGADDPFFNLNTPDDRARAECRAARELS
ncbi:MAG: NTP transferase domain-containing protein [Gluconacetobacter diazotrophicus]|nr:NTP transferase domain-containing protein [Gluconacetobacter diazotrophicus]